MQDEVAASWTPQQIPVAVESLPKAAPEARRAGLPPRPRPDALASDGPWPKAEDAMGASEDAVARLRRGGGWDTPSTAAASSTSAALRAQVINDACSSVGSCEDGLQGMAAAQAALTQPGRDRDVPESGVGSGGVSHGGAKAALRGAPPPENIFRRPLYASELASIRALLAPPLHDLRDLAAREFDWAVSVGGALPGLPGHVDFASALTALRQLSYLNGLPAVNSDAARWFFKLAITRHPGPKGPDIIVDEFQLAVEQMLQHAVEGR